MSNTYTGWRFIGKVYGSLPGSYGELNDNTYIGVIKEQGFDILSAYVDRLAAAVRGKTEEAGREALREAISAIREEARRSPAVKALFDEESCDGGVGADNGKRLNDLRGVNFYARRKRRWSRGSGFA